MSQLRNHIEIFRGSLAGQCPNCEKYLEYFSKFGFLMFLTTQSGDLFASGRSSCEGYTEIFEDQITTLSRVELPVAKNTLKIFQKFFCQVLWRLALVTFSRLDSIVKNECFAFYGQFFLNFLSIPLIRL